MGNRQNSIKISMKKSNMPYRKAYIPSRRSTYIVDSGGEILVAGRLATLLFLKEVVKISIIDPYNDPCDVDCLSCGLYDSDMGCTCPSVDKSYACSLEPDFEFLSECECVDLPGNPD